MIRAADSAATTPLSSATMPASAAIAPSAAATAPVSPATPGVATRLAVDALPSVRELPNPFQFFDGSPVGSRADWPRRRAELLELIQTYEYGHLPPAPPAGAVSATPDADYVIPRRTGSNKDDADVSQEPLPAGARREKLLVTVAGPDGKSTRFHLLLTLPPGEGARPVIVRGDLCWGPVKPEILAAVLKAGYALAEFNRTDIVPDKKGPRDVGLYLVYPEGDFSALSAWAWGYHRTIDYLLTRPDIDSQKIAVTGHSRGGKTTLLAGATDERIALTNPNCSGCGGAGCYRRQADKSEDITAILRSFPHWFQPQFDQFIGKVDRLPIDQHSVKALIAPRALLQTEALGDLWANPEGSQITYAAAREVFAWLAVPDQIAIHYRQGTHEQNLQDWETLLRFADHLFQKKAIEPALNSHPFPDAPKPWSWAAPAS